MDEVKKPRGNPNLIKGHKENEKNKAKKMAEKETPEPKPNTETTTPPIEKKVDALPSDLFSDKIPTTETLPLDGAVKQKDYAQLPNTEGTTPPPPPTNGTTPPPAGGEVEPKSFEATPPNTVQVPTTPPADAPMTEAEMQSQAKQTVDLMLKGYEKLHTLGRWLGKVDENELATLHAEGKIDLNRTLPVGLKTITVQRFFSEYNQGIDQSIVVTDEFKAAIRPPLERICLKRRWFLSDEVYVAMLVSDDLATKVSLLVALKKSCNLVLKAVQEMEKKKNKPSQEKKETPETFGDAAEWKEPEPEGNPPIE